MLCVCPPVVLGSFAFIFQSFTLVHNFCIHFLFLLHQENSFRFVCFDLCVCMCVSVTYNPSCLFFPDTSVQLPWQSTSVWDGWIDGEREREREENVSVIKLLPLSHHQMSSSLSPDPSISISSTPQLLYTSILSSLFLSNLMYSCYFSLTYFYCLSSPSSSEKQGWTDILGHLSIPWLFDQPDNLLRSLKYLSKTDLFIIKRANLAF